MCGYYVQHEQVADSIVRISRIIVRYNYFLKYLLIWLRWIYRGKKEVGCTFFRTSFSALTSFLLSATFTWVSFFAYIIRISLCTWDEVHNKWFKSNSICFTKAYIDRGFQICLRFHNDSLSCFDIFSKSGSFGISCCFKLWKKTLYLELTDLPMQAAFELFTILKTSILFYIRVVIFPFRKSQPSLINFEIKISWCGLKCYLFIGSCFCLLHNLFFSLL